MDETHKRSSELRLPWYDIRLAVALFCVLTCLYGVTGRGHIDISDGETMYMVTESLIERGTFAMPEPRRAGDAYLTATRAPNGNRYADYGPLQSLLSIPLYLIGRWSARAFPASFYGYFTRFFVSFFNSPVHAITVSMLYLLGVDLGYRRRTALFVALLYGLATIGWPYGRTFFAESLLVFWLVLATWSVYRYAMSGQWQWMSLAGVAVGAGLATKYVMIVAGPALVLYVLLQLLRHETWRTRWLWFRKALLAGGIPFALILSLLLLFNYARFGNVLETGYTKGTPGTSLEHLASTAAPLVSLYSMFFSSGKGFFFFSPPTVLSLWGIPLLFRRRRDETFLMLAVAVSYPLFYSIFSGDWHGGAGWGPRYIMCITPFLILPVGAFLESIKSQWWRVSCATLVFVIGFWVQISTVFVNFSSYVFSDVPAEKQRYYPIHSTLLALWQRWPQQTLHWQRYDYAVRTPDAQFYTLSGGFYDVEVPEMAPYGRWMGGEGNLFIYAQPQQTLTVRVAYFHPRWAVTGQEPWSGLRPFYDGVVLASDRQKVGENEAGTQWVETMTLAADNVQVFPGTLVLTATAQTPTDSGDARLLSVFVEKIEVFSDGMPLVVKDVNLPRPLPVSTTYSWSADAMVWFYDPSNARPFDVWPWYVWDSGVPLSSAKALIVILMSLLGCGLIVSGIAFVCATRKVTSSSILRRP